MKPRFYALVLILGFLTAARPSTADEGIVDLRQSTPHAIEG